MDEFIIQNALYHHVLSKQHSCIIPNIYLGSSEADLISVTKAGYINEYEIKITRSDFKADFKKSKHSFLKDRQKTFRAYFWFVTPEGLVDVDEIPEYAGFIAVRKGRRVGWVCREIKRPPRLCSEKINTWQKDQILTAYMHRFWNMRDRVEATNRQLKLF